MRVFSNQELMIGFPNSTKVYGSDCSSVPRVASRNTHPTRHWEFGQDLALARVPDYRQSVSRIELPTGTVTFLFTDIEGSTKLLHELGVEAYSDVLAEHRRILRAAFAAHRGVEVDTQGDAFFVAFPTAPDAVWAASEAQELLAVGPIRVRMGIHTGTPHVSDEGYVGEDVHKGARIASAGHGGQVLLSTQTRELVTVEVIDLGEHRLKDFTNTVAIFQLGSERFPPLKTVSNTNLPRPASSCIGREKEVTDVVSFLQDGARLLTLTGPGGSGKTRLSIEAAAEVVPRFRNGVFWVGLAPLRDPALVTETIAQILGAKDDLAQHIAEREMLLVLDNLEQVIEAALELASLVEACPNLRLLVTSRELLRVRGEVEYPVPPLADPDAVELFSARSGLDPDDAITVLCRRLDNLPLAVELAAARTKVLSPAQILDRLSERLDLLKGGRDADARQRTLRATIEWSYDLLSREEKTLFARLAVFAGGSTLEAAVAIAGADLDTIESLVDKSLVRHTAERFWMLETIREYAADRLGMTGDDEILHRRHAEYFQALAEEAAPQYLREDSKRWLDLVDQDHDNLRAAYDWFESSGHTQDVLRLVFALFEFWQFRGHFVEGGRRIDAALSSDDRPTSARAGALRAAADIAGSKGDLTTCRARTNEALAMHRALGDRRGVALSLWSLGYVSVEEGNAAEGQRFLEESVRILRELGDEHTTLHVTRTLAFAYHQLGDLDRARELHEENLERARALGNRSAMAVVLGSLSAIAVEQGRLQDAWSIMRENHPIYVEIGDVGGIGESLCRMAKALAVAGRAATAARVLSCFEAFRDEMGGAEAWVERMSVETLTAIRRQLDDATFAHEWEEGRKLSHEQAAALALDSDL
jgi:predicted ATPase/class 3 adenylate cyclase